MAGGQVDSSGRMKTDLAFCVLEFNMSVVQVPSIRFLVRISQNYEPLL